MSDSVVVLVSYRAQPGKEDLARRELRALVKTVTSTEPACLGITLLEDANDPGHILLHEHWTDEKTFRGPHMQTPHIQKFIARAGGFLAGPPEITFWQPVGAKQESASPSP